MSGKFDLLKVEAEAEQVIHQFSITSLPVCPFTIAKKSGIDVCSKESTEPGVSGFLIRVGNTFAIYHASHVRNEGYIRFTVAHELGHYFLPGHPDLLFPNGNGTHRSKSGFVSDDRVEREADQFAASLLMPESLFKKAVDGVGRGFSAIQSLADLCKTSITSTAIRYAKFTDDAIAIIVSSGDRVEYCFLSDRLKNAGSFRWLKKGDVIAPRSATAIFNKTISNVVDGKQEEGTCWLDDWFDDAPQVKMNEDVIGLGTYGKTLTVLFTDEDLEDDEHSEEDED